ncbi:hypothetical protein NQ315_017467 [Exocentrus adspersus]|uniref:Uncharacterized protein n=1 Tax=Exocentrus adspersus TaxID=1586481 RepID=A0AAV8VKB1_9CUCU|nr:hypothetical protein NQ315_017467 [Exocentrus adspersus]
MELATNSPLQDSPEAGGRTPAEASNYHQIHNDENSSTITDTSRDEKRPKAQASPEPAAQTPAKAQVYPGHSKAKEPVADQPLPQADVPPASQKTSTELTSQEGDEQVRVAGNCCSSRPEFAVTVRRSYVSWGTAVVFGQSSPRPYAAPLPLSAFINVYSSRGIAVVPGQNSPRPYVVLTRRGELL